MVVIIIMEMISVIYNFIRSAYYIGAAGLLVIAITGVFANMVYNKKVVHDDTVTPITNNTANAKQITPAAPVGQAIIVPLGPKPMAPVVSS